MIIRESELGALATRIRNAIEEELRASSRGLQFRAWDVVRHGGLLHMTLEPESKQSVLDESLEEGTMGWDEAGPGSADIISILPAASAANECLSSGRPPKNGSNARARVKQ
jgi:hypothetical protein